MEFRSKIDKFFIVFISITLFIIMAVFLIPLIFDSEKTIIDVLIVLTLCIFSIAFILWTSFSIKYIFDTNTLLVKGGLFKTRIPYDDITKITETTEIFTGYRVLASKDGLEIFYKKGILGSVKISPLEKERFLTELKKRCPNIIEN
ncbi:PH domain-containing protein [Ureibacillus sp. Re31]|uniref:PH domain-containing protein n=1 Tax=Ureibacillus galli TaxID=2762222 RepID=A0ABR8X8D7_9BACL|nr:PH domain-containing protein [Ureibacillus galli]MBD8025181.1 PH domain-containing protein [Ureibacillus galli]